MTKTKAAAAPATMEADGASKLLKQYGCGPDRVHGDRQRPLRAAPAVRQRRPSWRRPATASASRPSPAPCATSSRSAGCDRGDLRAREPQARLLPVDGVPHRPLAGQQRHQPAARSDRAAGRRAEEPRLARPCSSRSRTRAWATAAWAGWRPASSTRWPRCSSRPWATACATSTASSGRRSGTAGSSEQPDNWLRRPDPWEVARPQRAGRGQAGLLLRAARRSAARRSPAGRPA